MSSRARAIETSSLGPIGDARRKHFTEEAGSTEDAEAILRTIELFGEGGLTRSGQTTL
jgi:hypothetical protein